MLLKTVAVVVIVPLALLALIQLIPYGRNRTNPSVIQDSPWPNQQARVPAVRACIDCHSKVTW